MSDAPLAPAAELSRAEHGIRVLLIDDQAIIGEAVRRMLATEKDITFHFCQDPTKAVETANQFEPTVILQDLVMPDIDGLTLVKFLRANAKTRQTPLVVLSSKEEPITKAQAFGLGANDYLVKLPDKLEVIARVRYHSASYIHLLERNEAYRRLEQSRKELADEVQQAARYVQSLLPAKLTNEIKSDWRFVPSTQLGGDMFGYHWLTPEKLAIYLLDVSGHGVGSSLLAVSAANLLSAQSLPNTDFNNPGQVLNRLNSVFRMEKQHGKYFTMWYGVYDKTARTLISGNAGHPPGLLYTGDSLDGAAPLRLDSGGCPIGWLDEYEYETRTDTLGKAARLLIYSDGVFEIEKPDGAMWTLDEFVDYMQVPPGGWTDGMLDRVLAQVREVRAGELLADDYSMLEINFDAA